jgi:hypothetical protein
MKKIYPLFLIPAFFTSCGMSLNYLGQSYQQTHQIDVYVDPSTIRKPYRVIGKGYPRGTALGRNDINRVQKLAVELAKKKGADAVLFEDYFLVNTDQSVKSSVTADTLRKGITLSTTIGASPGAVLNTGRNILFLKYE